MDWWMWPLMAWFPMTTAIAAYWRRPLRRPADVVRPGFARAPVPHLPAETAADLAA